MEKKKTTKKSNIASKKKKIIRKTAPKSNKNRKKAFTLIELLAVIIILGVLMVVAIPAVTTYIQNSRKSSYVATAHNVISGARTKVNDGTLSMLDRDTTYYLPYRMVKGEKEVKSPYGDFEEAYVVVTFDGNGYDYYWTSRDTTNTGIYLTYNDLLDNDKIVNDMIALDTNIGVGNRTKIVVYNDDGTVKESKNANVSSNVSEKGSIEASDSGTYTETAESYFDFDPSTGTINRFIMLPATVVINDYNACANALINDGWYAGTIEETENYCRDYLVDDVSQSPTDLEYLKTIGAITSYTINSPINVVIPENINGVNVVSIKQEAFNNTYVETITIPSSVTHIDYCALCNIDGFYNIINKTGRSFDWSSALENEEYASFEFGIVPSTSMYKNVIIVSESISPKIVINFDKMFSINGLAVTLLDNDGYDVFYYSNDEWVTMSVDDAFYCGSGKIINQVAFNYCTTKIKISKNNQKYFEGYLFL